MKKLTAILIAVSLGLAAAFADGEDAHRAGDAAGQDLQAADQAAQYDDAAAQPAAAREPGVAAQPGEAPDAAAQPAGARDTVARAGKMNPDQMFVRGAASGGQMEIEAAK